MIFPDHRGQESVDEGLLRDHVARFRDDLARDPDDVVALHGLGVAYRNLGLLDDATAVLARAANRQPEALGIQRALAGTLLDAVRRRPDDARMWRDVRRQADRILALDPDAVEGWRLHEAAAVAARHDDALISLASDLATHDPDGDHEQAILRLREVSERRFDDWRWIGAVDAWQALAALDPVAGRTGLVAFLLQNSRLVPRSSGRVWRAVRQTMALRGDFRLSTFAALALGVALAIAIALGAYWTDRDAFPAVAVIALVILPMLSLVAVRTWLVGWPPLPAPHQPWRDISTAEIVRVARAIAPLIDRIRPGN